MAPLIDTARKKHIKIIIITLSTLQCLAPHTYKEFFDSMTAGVSSEKQRAMQKTATKIISLAGYFRKTNESHNLDGIPASITENLGKKDYLENIGLYQSDATKESDCCKVGGGTELKFINIGGPGRISFIGVEEPIPVRHRRDYYRYHKAQDGTEEFGTFRTFSPTAD